MAQEHAFKSAFPQSPESCPLQVRRGGGRTTLQARISLPSPVPQVSLSAGDALGASVCSIKVPRLKASRMGAGRQPRGSHHWPQCRPKETKEPPGHRRLGPSRGIRELARPLPWCNRFRFWRVSPLVTTRKHLLGHPQS